MLLWASYNLPCLSIPTPSPAYVLSSRDYCILTNSLSANPEKSRASANGSEGRLFYSPSIEYLEACAGPPESPPPLSPPPTSPLPPSPPPPGNSQYSACPVHLWDIDTASTYRTDLIWSEHWLTLRAYIGMPKLLQIEEWWQGPALDMLASSTQ